MNDNYFINKNQSSNHHGCIEADSGDENIILHKIIISFNILSRTHEVSKNSLGIISKNHIKI